MTEIDNSLTQTEETQSLITPEIALNILKVGNNRFIASETINRDISGQIKDTASGQYPFATILSCIDSRVPAEMIFDQGIGDIFNVRIAGNFVNKDILGCLEFACKVAGSKLILVLGHSSCGAVKGACDNVELGNLTEMLNQLMPAVNSIHDISENRNSSNQEFVQRVADKNVQLTMENISSQSPLLNKMIENEEIAVVGAMYDVASGVVTFY